MLGKAVELFITELSKKAWVHTVGGRRKTLLKADLCNALATSDMYDCKLFKWLSLVLIDIIPPDKIVEPVRYNLTPQVNERANYTLESQKFVP